MLKILWKYVFVTIMWHIEIPSIQFFSRLIQILARTCQIIIPHMFYSQTYLRYDMSKYFQKINLAISSREYFLIKGAEKLVNIRLYVTEIYFL